MQLLAAMIISLVYCCYVITVNQEAQAAKEMLLMATSSDEQKMWVQRLSKKVSRKGLGQQQVTSGAGGDRSAPGYVLFFSVFSVELSFC